MRAECRNNHAPTPMEPIHTKKIFRCPECGEVLAPEQIEQAVPQEYRYTGDRLQEVLMALADFEIMGVLHPGRELSIEYPRRESRPNE